jgi:hypothetical protein
LIVRIEFKLELTLLIFVQFFLLIISETRLTQERIPLRFYKRSHSYGFLLKILPSLCLYVYEDSTTSERTFMKSNLLKPSGNFTYHQV